MNLFFIPPLISSILIFLFGLHIFLKKPSSPTHRANLYLCLSFTLWLGAYSLMYVSANHIEALKWARIGVIGVALIPFNNCLFNFRLLNIKTYRSFLYTPLLFAVIIIGLDLTPYIYKDTNLFFWGYYPVAGPLHFIVILNVIVVWTYGITFLYKRLKEKSLIGDWTGYHQTRYILIGWLGCLFCTVDFLPKYGIPVYPIACFIAPYFIAISMFALTKLDLLINISLLTRKILIVSGFSTIAMAIFTTTYFIIRSLSYAYNTDVSVLLSIFSGFLGLLTYPLFFKFRSLVDGLLYPEYNRIQGEHLKINQAILESSDNNALTSNLIRSLISYFQTMKISFYLWDEDKKSYILQKLLTDNQMIEAVPTIEENAKVPQYFENHEYLLITDLNHNLLPNYKVALEDAMLQLQAVLAIPIKKTRLHGILTLGQKESGLPYTRQEIRDIKGFADLAAIAIVHSHAQQSAIRDSLTNLYNRRSIKELLTSAINHSKLFDEQLFVAIIDIDHFKKINDTYGHLAGDEVIKRLSGLIQEMTSNLNDNSLKFSAGRLGGEEFILILDRANYNKAKSFLMCLMTKIRSLIIKIEKNVPISFTVSIGAAAFPNDGVTAVDLIRKSDEMLYKAKSSGRNQIIFTSGETITECPEDLLGEFKVI